MKANRFYLRVIALAFFVGAMPFLLRTHAYAEEANRWLDDYHKPVGLTYNAQATVQTTYLWRGLYAGGFNMQASANVGYGGLYLDMWWNIGTPDWSFTQFQPEVDFTLGFSRWGVNIYLLYIHNFQHGFFDFNYYGSGRNALELGVRYTVSSKLPLSILWATRFTDADAYINSAGDTVRAHSSYLELSYTHPFPHGFSLGGAVGLTPWRSLYTGYQREFAVNNIAISMAKDWSLSEHCGLSVKGMFSINPSAIAANPSSVKWLPLSPGAQSINANIGVTVYLK